MKTLVLVRGLPGAGKSTFVEDLLSMTHPGAGKSIAADDFMMEDGEYVWKKEKLFMAHSKCRSTVELWMRGNTSLILVHNTFSTPSELQPYIDLASRYEYRVHSVVVENRHEGCSVHNVPQETLDKLLIRFSVRL